jgi:hypothetical protein
MSVYVILAKSVAKSDQNVNYSETLKHDKTGIKVRLSIRSNPYRFQCHARAEVWSPVTLSWNEAVSLDSGAMKTEVGLYIVAPGRVVDGRDFLVDRNELLNQLKAILA